MKTDKRYLCLDVGDVRIGVAVSDPTATIASPVGFIKRIGYSKDIMQIIEYSNKYNTKTIIVGLPLSLKSEKTIQTEKTIQFSEELKKYGFEIIFEDERFTSHIAEDFLINSNISRKNRKTKVDQIAATVILQSWLDKRR